MKNKKKNLEIHYPVGGSDFESQGHLTWRYLIHVNDLTIDLSKPIESKAQ